MIKDTIKLIVFISLALLLHAMLIFYHPIESEPNRSPAQPQPLKIQALPKKTEERQLPVVSSQLKEKKEQKPDPVRVTSNDEKRPLSEVSSQLKKEEEEPKSQLPVASSQSQKEKEKPKKETQKTTDQLKPRQPKQKSEKTPPSTDHSQRTTNNKQLTKNKTQLATDKAPTNKVEDLSPPATDNKQLTTDTTEDLSSVVKKLSDEKKETVKSAMSESEYRRYLQSQNMGRVKGKPTPQLIHAFHNVAEILAVHRYYGMKIIALDVSKPKTVVELVRTNGNFSFQKIENFNWALYSNRVFERTAPYFEKYRKEIVSQGLLPKKAKLYSVSPNSVDTYYRYKQLEVINQAGHSKDNVANTVARFHKTDFGGWIMAVERLQLTNGKIITIPDFELEKVQR